MSFAVNVVYTGEVEDYQELVMLINTPVNGGIRFSK